jgi:hypothetical protein
MSSFGIQPEVRLLVNGEIDTSDSSTKVRISIANVQSSECGCTGNIPCRHNNAGDNTCFEMQELFGNLACPAGTSECLPDQTNVQLYRSDPNDPTVGEFDKECRNSDELQDPTRVHLTNYCSDEVPCKQVNDGTCMPKVSFNPAASGTSEPETTTVEKCRAVEFWRRAVPAKSQGWFFETDPSCNLDVGVATSCASGQYYAMDKWCEHNCHPITGQEPFCPESHCDCAAEEIVIDTPEKVADWQCPLEKYGSAECRCSAGTEQCGSIVVQLNQGVANFEHLTIGTPGKYTLRVEVINPEPLTNRVQIEGHSAMFVVAPATSPGNLCRAQAQWRQPDLDDSVEHGAGEAWFYNDSNNVIVNADGSVDTERVYAMDTWCRANHCADHTLVSHCELVDTSAPEVPVCANGNVDSFGDCCDTGVVDSCGVCNGDGSTCLLSKYLSTFAPEGSSERTEAIFADHRCDDIASPCMHLNDGSCVPKTINSESEEITGMEHHCFLDRSATANTAYWKFGNWDSANGMASMEGGTFEGTQNTDCFCPAGTVDTSPKLEAELACIQNEGQRGRGGDDRERFFYANQAVIVYDEPCPDGVLPATYRAKKFEDAGPDGHSLCGAHFENSIGEGSCASPNPFEGTCVNDKPRCIRVGALTTAKLYKHCQCTTCEGNQFYTELDNSEGTAPKLFNIDPQHYDTSRIATLGSGGSPTTTCSVLGSLFDCLERDSPIVSDLCRKNTECSGLMDLLDTCVTSGETLPNCIMEQRSNNRLYADVTNGAVNSQCNSGNVMSTSLSLDRALAASTTQVMMAAQSAGYSSTQAGYSVTSTSSGSALLNNNNGLPSSPSDDSGLGSAALGGIIAGVAGVAIVGAVAITHRTRAKKEYQKEAQMQEFQPEL